MHPLLRKVRFNEPRSMPELYKGKVQNSILDVSKSHDALQHTRKMKKLTLPMGKSVMKTGAKANRSCCCIPVLQTTGCGMPSSAYWPRNTTLCAAICGDMDKAFYQMGNSAMWVILRPF